MSQKRRMKKLKRKARVDRQPPKQSAQSTADPYGGIEMGSVMTLDKMLEEIARDDPNCRDSMYLSSGVMIKVYDQRLWVVAPKQMRNDENLFSMLNDVMIDHFCGREKYLQVYRQSGEFAAHRLLEDVIIDVDYYEGSGSPFDTAHL